MGKITPFLWYDKEAKAAAAQYTAALRNSRIHNLSVLNDTPSGDVDMVQLDLCGQPFSFMSAGPIFKFTPAISFLVACETAAEVDAIWKALVDGGSVLMELGAYPFSPRYGWLMDRYGVSWQVMTATQAIMQPITPTLMFTGEQCGKAEEAMHFYTSVFGNASMGGMMRYGKDEGPDAEGTVKHAEFRLEGQLFAAMDSAYEHGFGFTEAISFMVSCDTQAEIDHYWDSLSAHPEAEQCGWLKDRYGVSWQIVPSAMNTMQQNGTPEQMARVTEAFLKMKKFDLAALQRAYEG